MTELPDASPNLDRSLLTRSVLVGLTCFVPLPWVDDMAADALRRRLVQATGEANHKPLGPEDVTALLPPQRGGMGCVLGAVLYPLKRLFRKVFFFLEIKRAVDVTSRAFHLSWLLGLALREGRLTPGDPARAAAVREAVERTCLTTEVRPVERALGAALRSSGDALRAAAGMMTATLRAVSRRDPGEIARALAGTEAEDRALLEVISARVQQALDQVPRAHFEEMAARFRRELESPGA